MIEPPRPFCCVDTSYSHLLMRHASCGIHAAAPIETAEIDAASRIGPVAWNVAQPLMRGHFSVI
jgi:hypothetical protein